MTLIVAIISLIAIVFMSTEIAVAIVLVSSFSMGLFQMADIPLLIPKLISEGLSALLLIKALYFSVKYNNRRFALFGAWPIAGVLLSGLCSGIALGSSVASLGLFARDVLKFYTLFLSILNIPISPTAVSRLIVLLIVLFAVQIPVSWLKLVIVGIDEHWIGTVHYTAGELSVLLPLIAAAFLLSAYMYSGKPRYLIWIFLFFMFSVIGEKRATIFLFPMLFIGEFWAYCSVKGILSGDGTMKVVCDVFSPRKILTFALVGFAALYIAGRSIPSLNPEERVWGTFDLAHIVTYSITYSFRRFDSGLNVTTRMSEPNLDDRAVQMGRMAMIASSFEIARDSSIFRALLGHGGGSTNSSYLSGSDPDQMYKRFGIRGSTPGMVRILLETGFLGLISMFWFFALLFRSVSQKLILARDPVDKIFCLGVLGMNIVFVLDFCIYSNATQLYGVLTPMYFFLNAVLICGISVGAALRESLLRFRTFGSAR